MSSTQVNSRSAVQRYYSLLGAADREAMEDRVVETIRQALPRAALTPPVRLSSIAKRFQIEPKPRFISGTVDGQIDFVPEIGSFVISLCSRTDPTNIRHRFTYAHEFAHRFFFVKTDAGWRRALELASEGSDDFAARLRQRRVLKNIEEALCNAIARRVLIPDEFIASTNLDAWFEKCEAFTNYLSESARCLGVSRQALLIRLHGALGEERRGARYAFTIEMSKGNTTGRGAAKLRVRSGLFPASSKIEFAKVLYPGADVESLAPGTLRIFLGQMGALHARPFSLRLPLVNRQGEAELLLEGWGQRINSKQMLVWGTAQVPLTAVRIGTQ